MSLTAGKEWWNSARHRRRKGRTHRIYIRTESKYNGRRRDNKYKQRATVSPKQMRRTGQSGKQYRQKASGFEDRQTLSWRMSITESSPAPSSTELIPWLLTNRMGCPPERALPLPSVNSPRRLLARNGLTLPGAILCLVNALFLATRWMMSSGAITCPKRRHIQQPVRGSRL